MEITVLFMLWVAVTMATDIELYPSDIGSHATMGRIDPIHPSAVIGQDLVVTCSIKRKRLLAYNITINDVFFRIHPPHGTPVTVPAHYVKQIGRGKIEMRYGGVEIDQHRGEMLCLARINATSSLIIDGSILYVGYAPGKGLIEEIVTDDLKFIRVFYDKSHANPSYVTSFWLLCRYSASYEFTKCTDQKRLTNDTIEFRPRDTQFLANQKPLSIRIQSWSKFGGEAFGNIETFNLYEKYKPAAVTNLPS